MNATISVNRNNLAVLGSKLDTLSPLKVLGRGYALAYKENVLLKDASHANVGDEIELRLEKGKLLCRVEKISV